MYHTLSIGIFSDKLEAESFAVLEELTFDPRFPLGQRDAITFSKFNKGWNRRVVLYSEELSSF